MSECVHDGTELIDAASDPLLPDYIEPLECPECGEVYRLDTDTGNIEVDA